MLDAKANPFLTNSLHENVQSIIASKSSIKTELREYVSIWVNQWEEQGKADLIDIEAMKAKPVLFFV